MYCTVAFRKEAKEKKDKDKKDKKDDKKAALRSFLLFRIRQVKHALQFTLGSF